MRLESIRRGNGKLLALAILTILLALALSAQAEQQAKKYKNNQHGGGQNHDPNPQRDPIPKSKPEPNNMGKMTKANNTVTLPGKMSPEQARDQLAHAGASLINTNKDTVVSISQLLESGSVGVLPASAATRQQLAAALAEALAEKQFTPEQADKISQELAAGAVADELTAAPLAQIKANCGSAMSDAGVSAEKIERLHAAFDKSVGEQQNQNLQALKADLHAIQSSGDVLPEQTEGLKSHLAAVADGPLKPGDESLRQLTDDLCKAAHEGALAPKQEAQLVHGIHTLLSGEATPTQADAVMLSAKGLLNDGHVSRLQVQKVLASLQSVYADVKHPTTQPAAPSAAKAN